MKTTYLLTVISIVEMCCTADMIGSFFLWVAYGIYRLIKDSL